MEASGRVFGRLHGSVPQSAASLPRPLLATLPVERCRSSFCIFVARPYATRTTGTHPLGRDVEPRPEFEAENLAGKHLFLVPNHHGAAPRPDPPRESRSSAPRKCPCGNGFPRSISFCPPRREMMPKCCHSSENPHLPPTSESGEETPRPTADSVRRKWRRNHSAQHQALPGFRY
jgi:hypothetical protein